MNTRTLIARINARGFGEALKACAITHHVLPREIVGRGMGRSVMRARREFVALLRARYGLSTPEIGALLGREHTTIMALLRPVANEGRAA